MAQKINLTSLTLVITDNCNFECDYCYKKKTKRYMSDSTAERALNFLLPFMAEEYFLNFYGGEPFLNFGLITKAVSFLEKRNQLSKKKATYSVTTNGSLLTEDVIRFLNENRFSVTLSFDGLAQDIARQSGSQKKAVALIERILAHSGISLETNSVFSPLTVGYLSKSIKFILELGVANVNLSLAVTMPWDKVSIFKLGKEMAELRKVAISFYAENNKIPIAHFREKKTGQIFRCSAGKDRLAISPEGQVWGCFLFADYFAYKRKTKEWRKYSFGLLDDFINNYKTIYPRLSAKYDLLSMDYSATSSEDCFLCPNLEDCSVCPVNAAFSSSKLGLIPDYVCTIQKIKIREKKEFINAIRRISSSY
jgi:sulfatase maturation enzyme AslB (radical SAM superfamily)